MIIIKKLDRLIIRAFMGPFIATFSVLVFIFLMQFMLRYLEEFVGKDLGAEVYFELIAYFTMNMVPQALPLSILLSSLMTFGNLGEHRELTAIKSAGISLTRVMLPVFVLVSILAVGDFLFYNYVVPKSNLNAYGLLYDIRTKKLALDIKPGQFYYGLPGYTVKVKERFADGKTLKGVIIYDHQDQISGNSKLVLADSGEMYTIYDERYLVLELYNGESYYEGSKNNYDGKELMRSKFQHNKMVFSLASFEMTRTKLELFSTNKVMRTIAELDKDLDSMRREQKYVTDNVFQNVTTYYVYQNRKGLKMNAAYKKVVDSVSGQIKSADEARRRTILNLATNQARNLKSYLGGTTERLNYINQDLRNYAIELMRKFSMSAACLVLFLIGAPIGAIVRKGGLGVPVIVSVSFFIVYYILSYQGEKLIKSGVLSVEVGMWIANGILTLAGLWFSRQAYLDAPLFEPDFYYRIIKRLRFKKNEA